MKWSTRHGLLALALLASVPAGVAAGSALTGQDLPPRPPAQDYIPRENSAAAEGESRGPDGHAWRVLVWQSQSGKLCALPGQLVGGRVGIVSGRDSKFRPWRIDDAGPCEDPSALTDDYPVYLQGTTHYEAEGGPTTLIWGLARSDVTTVTVHAPDGSQTQLRPSVRGAFVAAYPEQPDGVIFQVTAKLRDGREAAMKMRHWNPEQDPLHD
jgi:hypothetical protein